MASADVYSLAMTILVIKIQDYPFGEVYSRQLFIEHYGQSGHRDWFFYFLLGSHGVSGHFPAELQDLLYRCLNPNPKHRPSIYEFVECAWIVDAPNTPDARLTHELNVIMGLQRHPKDD